jgi:hypothetical protein
MATKRNKNGQFVKSGKGKATSSSKKNGSKKKGNGKAKGLAKHGGNLVIGAPGWLQAPAKGDSVATAIKKLQRNQEVLGHSVKAVAATVIEHDRALVGAGLISARGAR